MQLRNPGHAATLRVVMPFGHRITADDLALVGSLCRDAAIDREQRLPFDPPLVRRLFKLARTFEDLASEIPPAIAQLNGGLKIVSTQALPNA